MPHRGARRETGREANVTATTGAALELGCIATISSVIVLLMLNTALAQRGTTFFKDEPPAHYADGEGIKGEAPPSTLLPFSPSSHSLSIYHPSSNSPSSHTIVYTSYLP